MLRDVKDCRLDGCRLTSAASSPFIRLSTTSAKRFHLQVDDLVAKRQRGISSVED